MAEAKLLPISRHFDCMKKCQRPVLCERECTRSVAAAKQYAASQNPLDPREVGGITLGTDTHLPHRVRFQCPTSNGGVRIVWLEASNAMDAHLTALALSVMRGSMVSVHQGAHAPATYAEGRRTA